MSILGAQKLFTSLCQHQKNDKNWAMRNIKLNHEAMKSQEELNTKI
jgi:hypothetical protein